MFGLLVLQHLMQKCVLLWQTANAHNLRLPQSGCMDIDVTIEKLQASVCTAHDRHGSFLQAAWHTRTSL